MSIRNKAISGGIWNGLDIFGRQGLQFLVQLVLARLLVPADFGLIAIAVSLNQFTNVIVGAGLVDAVIQKKDLGECDLSTAFWMSFGASGFSYLCLFVLSPFLATAFGMPDLVAIIRVTALMLVFDAVNNIQLSQLYRALAFRTVFFINLPSLLIGGVVGVGAALYGAGVWALVLHYLAISLSRCLFANLRGRWRPALVFDRAVMLQFIKFSAGLIGLQFIDQVGRQIYVFLIGATYTPAHLGYYNRAISLQQISTMTVAGVVARVGLPTLSRLQDEPAEFLRVFRKAMRLLFGAVAPVLVGVAAVSEELVPALLGPQWNAVSSLLSALCVGGFVYLAGSLDLQAVVAKGQTGILFRVGLVTKLLQVGVLLCTYRYGLDAIVLGQVASMLMGVVLSRIVVKRVTGYGHLAFFHDISKPFMGAAFMYALLWLLPLPLLPKILIGACFYGCYAWLVHLEVAIMLGSLIQSIYLKVRQS